MRKLQRAMDKGAAELRGLEHDVLVPMPLDTDGARWRQAGASLWRAW